MPPRTILYTGSGGAGKAAVAAATARRCAAAGARTLLLSTDPARALADVMAVALGPVAARVTEHLSAQQVDAQAELDRRGDAVRAWAGDQLPLRPPAAGLAVVPGLDALLGLLVLADHHAAEEWDVIVVDWAATGDALPELARWWLDRDVTQPEGLVDALRGLARRLSALDDVLRDRDACSVRLVLETDAASVGQARRAITAFALHGVLTDAVVADRVLPAEVDGFFGPRRARQQEQLRALVAGVAPVPVLRAPCFAEEHVGPAMLDRLGDALFAGVEPQALLDAQDPEELVVGRDGAELRLALPFASREQLGLGKVGGELVISFDGHRRTLRLPPALDDYRASSARFRNGSLRVTFLPPA